MVGEGSLKVIFDEMFGPRWVRALEHLFLALHKEPRPKFLHLFDIAAAGSPDDQWVPSLGKDPCLVVTADRGLRGAPRLPEVCRQYGRTHILLSARTHDLNMFDKARAVIGVWPQLVDAWGYEGGSRLLLETTGKGRTFRLVRTPMLG